MGGDRTDVAALWSGSGCSRRATVGCNRGHWEKHGDGIRVSRFMKRRARFERVQEGGKEKKRKRWGLG